MRGNLAKGVAWLMLGAAVILAIELVWDYMASGNEKRIAEATSGNGGIRDEPLEKGSMSAFVLDGDESAIGLAGAPIRFDEECFDAHDLGEVRSSHDGGVVGIVSDLNADGLFEACAARLASHGWMQVQSGQSLRSTFRKGSGAIRWLYLDVTEVSGSSVAVFVLEEADEDERR
jgi:hypothetical protein